MKKTKKLVLFLMMFVMLMASGTVASAKVKITYHLPKEKMNRILDGRVWVGEDVNVRYGKNDKVKVSATSSNKKVAAIHVQKGLISVIPKGPGKATVTIKVTANGKTTKKALKYNYAAYKNPFTSFKISGKDRTSQFDKFSKIKIEAGKLSYKVNSGFKIISFTAYRWGKDNDETLKITNDFVLKKNDEVCIEYKNLKTNTYGELVFAVS